MPKSSFAIRSSLKAPQLKATKGPAARALCACMARATNSFPVPDSPVISTLHRRSDLHDHLFDAVNRRAISYHKRPRRAAVQFPFAPRQRLSHGFSCQGLRYQILDLFGLERFSQIMKGTFLSRLYGAFKAGVSRNNDAFQRGMCPLCPVEQFQTIHERHFQVGNEKVTGILFQTGQCLEWIAESKYSVPALFRCDADFSGKFGRRPPRRCDPSIPPIFERTLSWPAALEDRVWRVVAKHLKWLPKVYHFGFDSSEKRLKRLASLSFPFKA